MTPPRGEGGGLGILSCQWGRAVAMGREASKRTAGLTLLSTIFRRPVREGWEKKLIGRATH